MTPCSSSLPLQQKKKRKQTKTATIVIGLEFVAPEKEREKSY